MLGVKAVTERMCDDLVGHYPAMPGVSQRAQAVATTRRLENGLHSSMFARLSSGEIKGDISTLEDLSVIARLRESEEG